MFRNYFLKVFIFLKKKIFGFKKIELIDIKKKKISQDYQNKNLIKLILLKNKKLRKKNNYDSVVEDKSLFNSVFKIKRKIKVLDLGGGGGHMYYTFKKNYPFNNFLWYNYETPASVKLFKKNLKRDSRLIFTDKLENIPNNIDLLYCNSSFQYIQNQSEFIKNILKKKLILSI